MFEINLYNYRYKLLYYDRNHKIIGRLLFLKNLRFNLFGQNFAKLHMKVESKQKGVPRPQMGSLSLTAQVEDLQRLVQPSIVRLLLPLSLLPLPLSRLYFLQLPARSTVTRLDADASDRGQIQVRFLNHNFNIIARIPIHCINFNRFSTNRANPI